MRSIVASLTIALCIFLVASCGGGGGGGGDVTVTAKIVLQNGAEKELTATPLPLFLKIVLTFSSAVTPSSVEPLFSLKAGEEAVPVLFSWNADNTVATVRPKNLLDYKTTYTVAVAAGAVSDVSLSASVSKANITALSGAFTTMVQGDVNGDGKADPVLNANDWNAGGKNGRGYLFYPSGLQAAMPAQNAGATVTGDAAGRQFGMRGTRDLNYDGYADLLGYEALENSSGKQYLFFGAAGDAPISGGLISTGAANTFSGVADNEFFEMVASDDVNGDGYADIIAKSQCTWSVGCVYVFLGPDFAAQETSATADVTITGAVAGDWFGGEPDDPGVGVADVNGDGIADIIAGSPGAAGNSGRVQVFYGGSTLASKSASSADVTITGIGDFFGGELSLVDLDGDGRSDIVVPNSFYDSNRGRAYVFYSSTLADKGAANADVILTGENVGDLFGSDVETGDVNGDGLTDLLIDARAYDGGRGRAYIFYGGTGFVTKGAAEANIFYAGDVSDDLRLGVPADVTGDGIPDVIVYKFSSAAAQGKVYIFAGGSGMASAPVSSANIILSGEGTTDHFEFKRTLDVNGDGIADVIAGAYAYDSNRGRAYIFYGDAALSSRTADQANVIITGESANDNFGIF